MVRYLKLTAEQYKTTYVVGILSDFLYLAFMVGKNSSWSFSIWFTSWLIRSAQMKYFACFTRKKSRRAAKILLIN